MPGVGPPATVRDRAAAIIPAATVEASRGWIGGGNAALDISRNPSTLAAIAKEVVGATEAADCALNHSVEAAWYVVVLDVLDPF